MEGSSFSMSNMDAALSWNETEINSKDVPKILQATASHFSKIAPSSKANDLIRNSNDETVLCKLEDVLKTHFHPLHLTTLPSVVIYLLLNYFLLKQDNKEVEAAKKLYEDHITLLKEKNSELEERVRASSVAGSKQASSCTSCEGLQRKVEEVTLQCSKLKQSYDELCHINDQWALDYDTLAKHVANATGFHSIATMTSGSTQSGSTQSQQSSNSKYMPDPSCVRCGIYESQLEDKQQEVDGLRAVIVGLREDIKEGKERLVQKQRELSSLENEYQIARLQIQEIGDMQQTLHMKHDYRKMQRALQHKTKQYQDAVCEKLELQKQVEKLRQTFLKFFPAPQPVPHPVPHPAPQPPLHNPSMLSSRPPHSGGYYSFPMHSCRHNLQSHTVDPAPPTPPGLLARGDFRGAFAEKDEHTVPVIRLDEHPTNPRVYPSIDSVHPHHPPRGSTVVLAGGQLETRMSRSHSSDHISSGAGSHSTKVLGTNSPNNIVTNSTPYAITSIPSTLSSLGYVSEDPSYPIAPSLTRSPFSSSKSKGSLDSIAAGNETSSSGYGVVRPRIQKSRSEESANNVQSRNSIRPTSLLIPNSRGGASQPQQYFSCPNCRKTFSSNSDTFEPWFDHVKTCGV